MKTLLSKLFASFKPSRAAGVPATRNRLARLSLEALEDRQLLSTAAATVPGSWHQVPGTATNIAIGGGQVWSLNAGNNNALSHWNGSRLAAGVRLRPRPGRRSQWQPSGDSRRRHVVASERQQLAAGRSRRGQPVRERGGQRLHLDDRRWLELPASGDERGLPAGR